ncbi:MAG: LysM peptidoglycan-binding domain-containing protein [Anaerolineae bacterium]|nr:MAG: LysM peptidoglycan-binding domain-containing protein [Anaerolineae bacterium]
MPLLGWRIRRRSSRRLRVSVVVRLKAPVLACGVLLAFLSVACRRDALTPPSNVTAAMPVPSASFTLGPSPEPTMPQPTVSPTPRPTPTPAYPGTYAGTPTPDPAVPDVAGRPSPDVYLVRPGDTLTGIAWAFGCTVEELVRANGLRNANAIWVGQRLVIPVVPTLTGSALKLVPDSELVYGPAYIHFDLEGFVAGQAGYLASYAEMADGRQLSGAEIVQTVAQRFSVGPRVLLALLELRAGWVTDPDPPADTLTYPLGRVEFRRRGLYGQLEWTAAELNAGYYAWRQDGSATARLTDGQRVAFAPGLNAGTAGVQNYLATVSDGPAWQRALGPDGFPGAYGRLFGNPFAYTVEPFVPSDLVQPEMRLPWPAGDTWYLTGGPHEGWGRGSAWAGLDFVPGDMTGGCSPSREWATAAASGLVVRSQTGEVVVDLDGDGYEQSGWVLTYLHLAADGRVPAGTWVERGQRIGHPSCEGGFADATHVHIARRFNGEWIRAGAGQVPFVLSGWTAHEGQHAYDGRLTKGDDTRTACECMLDGYNGLVSDTDWSEK